MPNAKPTHEQPFNEAYVAQLFQHRYWSNEIAEEVVGAWRKSGLTKRDFSRKFNVKPYRLEHWDRRLRKEKRKRAGPPVQVYPVKVTDASGASLDRRPSEPSHGIEMMLPSGAVLKIGTDFDAGTLRRVLETVGC